MVDIGIIAEPEADLDPDLIFGDAPVADLAGRFDPFELAHMPIGRVACGCDRGLNGLLDTLIRTTDPLDHFIALFIDRYPQ